MAIGNSIGKHRRPMPIHAARCTSKSRVASNHRRWISISN